MMVAVGSEYRLQPEVNKSLQAREALFSMKKGVMGTGLKPLNHFRLKAVLWLGDRRTCRQHERVWRYPLKPSLNPSLKRYTPSTRLLRSTSAAPLSRFSRFSRLKTPPSIHPSIHPSVHPSILGSPWRPWRLGGSNPQRCRRAANAEKQNQSQIPNLKSPQTPLSAAACAALPPPWPRAPRRGSASRRRCPPRGW